MPAAAAGEDEWADMHLGLNLRPPSSNLSANCDSVQMKCDSAKAGTDCFKPLTSELQHVVQSALQQGFQTAMIQWELTFSERKRLKMLHSPGTVYLDWSDLNRAFNSFSQSNYDEDDRVLLGMVKEIARKGRLRLSFHHLSDVVAGHDESLLRERARWIDSLPNKKWILSPWKLNRLEARNFLLNRTQGTNHTLDVFTSFLGMFDGWTPQTLGNALKKATVEAYVCEVGLSAEGRFQHNLIREESNYLATHLANDRAAVVANGHRNLLAKVSQAKFKGYVNDIFLKSHRDLIHEGNQKYFELQGDLFCRPDDEAVLRWAIEALVSPSMLPHLFLVQVVTNSYADWLSTKDVNSKSFQRGRRSDADDFGHLAGAAYCDFFSCDKRIRKFIGRFREQIGRQPVTSYSVDGRLGFLKKLETHTS